MSLPEPYYSDDLVTLYHGDAQEILPLIPSKSADFVFTDPPYGHNNNDGDLISQRESALGHGENGAPRPIANDGPEANELIKWTFREARRLLHPGCCCCCCCCGGGPDPQFARWSLWLDEIVGFKHAVVWDKGGLGMGWHYRRNYEMVLVGQVPGAACVWNGGNTQANVVRFNKIIPSADQHPTEKPLALSNLFIRLHSNPGDLVLDPFAGSGTTLESAKALGRRAIGVELDETFCQMAAERLRQECLPLYAK